MLSVAVGILTGAAVAGFEFVTESLLEAGAALPIGVRALLPGAGLVVATVSLRWLSQRASPATADAYIRIFHDRRSRLNQRWVPGRIVASTTTLGSGGALGFEGPSIYLGSAIGSWVQHRFSRAFARTDAKLLLVAGAAAGVAAIFKAPATGAIFALEVPYQQDVAARAALPALLASAASYVTFVTLHASTEALFTVAGDPAFDAVDLGGAAAVGLLAGLGARGFAVLLTRAKQLPARHRMRWCIAAAGIGLAALAIVSHVLYGEALTLGPGYEAVRWAAEPGHGLLLVGLLLLLRAAATLLTISGGGAGGVFIPLVVLGALLGRLVGAAVPGENSTLFPLVGMAAFLGAGYRTPLAAVVFVAEATGRAGFVVPGLIATAISQLVMGRASVSVYQHSRRAGHVETRLELPVSSAVTVDPHTVSPDASVEELLHIHFPAARADAIPVVDDGVYLGMARIEDVADVPRELRPDTTAGEVLRDDLPIAHRSWNLRQAVAAMEGADVDSIPVLEDGRLVGILTTTEIVKLDEVLEETEDPL